MNSTRECVAHVPNNGLVIPGEVNKVLDSYKVWGQKREEATPFTQGLAREAGRVFADNVGSLLRAAYATSVEDPRAYPRSKLVLEAGVRFHFLNCMAYGGTAFSPVFDSVDDPESIVAATEEALAKKELQTGAQLTSLAEYNSYLSSGVMRPIFRERGGDAFQDWQDTLAEAAIHLSRPYFEKALTLDN